MYPNFELTLKVKNDRLRVAGPLLQDDEKLDADAVQVVVFAYVTQEPRDARDWKDRSEIPNPPATTVRGEVKLYRENPPEGCELIAGRQWSFEEQPINGQFKEGWAFASAVQVTIDEDGSIETYSWHSWVWIDCP